MARAQRETDVGAAPAGSTGGGASASRSRGDDYRIESARAAREHRSEIEARQVKEATAALASIITAGGKPLTVKQMEARALLVLDAAMTGAVSVPSSLLDAARATLDHVRWRTEMTKGRPRQRTDLSVATRPVVVNPSVKRAKVTGESERQLPAAAQTLDVAGT